MNSIARLVLAVAITSMISGFANSQGTIEIGGGLGILVPQEDFGGSTIDYYYGTKYGLSNGLNLHGKVRIGFFGITLMGQLDYSSVSNSGNSEPGQGIVEITQKVLTFKAGPEFQLKIVALPLTPYLGANVAINRFSGETTFQGVAEVPSATYVVQSASRLGLGFGGGAIVKLNPTLSLDVGVHYNLMNLAGRSWEDVNPFQDKRLDSYLALNDHRDPEFLPGEEEHFISSRRAIHSILFSVSILFGR